MCMQCSDGGSSTRIVFCYVVLSASCYRQHTSFTNKGHYHKGPHTRTTTCDRGHKTVTGSQGIFHSGHAVTYTLHTAVTGHTVSLSGRG